MDKEEADALALRLVTLAFAEDTDGMVREVNHLDRAGLLSVIESFAYLVSATYGNAATTMGMERMELWQSLCSRQWDYARHDE